MWRVLTCTSNLGSLPWTTLCRVYKLDLCVLRRGGLIESRAMPNALPLRKKTSRALLAVSRRSLRGRGAGCCGNNSLVGVDQMGQFRVNALPRVVRDDGEGLRV